MKYKISLMLILFKTLLYSQLLFQEDFNPLFNPILNDWHLKNLSQSPLPNFGWTQGLANIFPAFNGGSSDYAACGSNVSNSPNPAVLSAWFITPTLSITNDCVLQFATRTVNRPANSPDRLEVYLSTDGTGTNVGTTFNSVGTFSTLLVSVNPSLTGVGYPNQWTIYSATISGVPTQTVGRIGFRYHVLNGGPSNLATTSDYIGLDNVRFSGPCFVTLPSYTTCAGQSVTISAIGATSWNTYTWSQGSSNSNSIVVTPTASTVYSLFYASNYGYCLTEQATVTIAGNINVNVSATNNSVCPGGSTTLTATGPANSYTWSNSSSISNSIVVSPSSATIYTVTASTGGTASSCAGSGTIQIDVFNQPSVSILHTSTLVCSGKSFIITGAGTGGYLWQNSFGDVSSGLKFITTPSVAGISTYSVTGIDMNGCTDTTSIKVSCLPSPTLNVSPTATIFCVNDSVSLTASGASSYLWHSTTNSTLNPQLISTNVTATKKMRLDGYSNEGCVSSRTLTISVEVCTDLFNSSIERIKIYPNPFFDSIEIYYHVGFIEMYSQLGVLIQKVNSTGEIKIDARALNTGLYYIKLSDNNEKLVSVRKLIKQ